MAPPIISTTKTRAIPGGDNFQSPIAIQGNCSVAKRLPSLRKRTALACPKPTPEWPYTMHSTRLKPLM
eukprot:395043-Pyramimonas_sp.AAC.1